MRKALCILLILLTASAYAAYDQILVIGTQSKLIEVMMRSATTGQPLTGLAVGAVTVSYVREGASAAVALAAPAVLTTLGTWETDAWKETQIAGVYQYGVPDACLVTAANAVTLVFTGTAAITAKYRIVLTGVDMQDATDFGMTNLNDTITSRMATFTYTPERGTDSALLASNYTPERGTDSAMLASSYVTERGTDNALLATNYTAERGTNNALLASSYTPERGTDSAMLASSYTPERGTDSAATATNLGNLITTVGTAGAGLTALGDTRLANLDTTVGSRMATFTYTPERGTDSALLASNYTPERGTNSAMLASSYVTERGTDSAVLASSFTQLTQRGEPPTAASIAALVLATPSNKLATDGNGYVTSANERGTDSAMLASSYVAERGTNNALLASNYTPERGTDNALLATNYTAERGTNNALLASNYTPERGTDSALLASSFTQLTQRAEPDNTNIGLIKTAADAIKVIADKLATMYEGTGPYKYTVASLVNAPSGGGGGGDATAANQTLILDSLIAAKGATFNTATDSLEAIRNRGDDAWTTGAVSEGKIAVDHNTGGADAMRIVMAGGDPISGATIRAYTKADYDAGIYTLRAQTVTGDDGRWAIPLYLDDDVPYSLIIQKLGVYGPVRVEVIP